MSEIIQWPRGDGTFLQLTRKDLEEKLAELKCSELRAIARAMKSGIKYWTMSKNTLVTQIISRIAQIEIGQKLSTQNAVNEMCNKLGLLKRLRKSDVKPIDGVVCAASESLIVQKVSCNCLAVAACALETMLRCGIQTR